VKKDFLTIRDMSSQEILDTFKLALEMKKDRSQFADALKGQTLALIFEKPSLRTRTTFDVGIQQLGGFSIYLSPAEINLGKRESVYDVAKNLERMVQGIMIRTFAHQIVEDMSQWASIPIINGLTDFSHPCQAMADALTNFEEFGILKDKNITFIENGNNVDVYLIFTAAKLGDHFTLAAPDGYDMPAEAVEIAQGFAAGSGSTINLLRDPRKAVANADVIYTDTWTSMGQEEEARTREKAFASYQVNEKLVSDAKSETIVMHCLPAHRGQEITDAVADGPHSRLFPQAHNRLHAQKAVLVHLLEAE